MTIKVTRDMLQHEYAWEATGGDDPEKVRADARLLNRKEGYEVIPMIQKVADHLGYETESDVRQVEDLIATELPGNVRGRDKVFEWLVNHLES